MCTTDARGLFSNLTEFENRDLELCLRQMAEMTTGPCLSAVFSFSVKLSSFASASNARNFLPYSPLCTHFFQENTNANLSFAFCRQRDSKSLYETEPYLGFVLNLF